MKIDLAFKCIVPGCDKPASQQDRVSTCSSHWGCCFICGGMPDERHDHHSADAVREVKDREEFDDRLRRSLYGLVSDSE